MLALSSVSRDLNDFLDGEIVDKVRLKVNLVSFGLMKEQDFLLRRTSRKYKHIIINSNHPLFWSVVKKFANSIEDLIIDGEEKEFIFVEFPKLKRLELSNVSNELEDTLIHGLTQKNTQLEALKLKKTTVPIEEEEIRQALMMRFIWTQKNLKELDSAEYDMNAEFDRSEFEGATGLSKLEVLRYTPSYEDISEVLGNTKSLHTLNVVGVKFADDVKFFLSKMPRLTKLEISFHEDITKINPHINTSIVDLKFSKYQENPTEEQIMLTLLKALPELKLLNIEGELSVDMLNFAVFNMKKLEEIVCEKVDNSVWIAYDGLKIEHAKDLAGEESGIVNTSFDITQTY